MWTVLMDLFDIIEEKIFIPHLGDLPCLYSSV